MPNKSLIVFPNQLFEKLPADIKEIFLLEEDSFFREFNYHKKS